MKFLPTNITLQEAQIIQALDKIKPYIDRLRNVVNDSNYESEESSINLPFDATTVKKINELKERLVTKELKYVVNIGIGGASLASKAIYDALYGHYDILQPKRFPKMIFLDTNNTRFIYLLIKLLEAEISSPAQVIINIVSTSGTTVETVTNSEVVLGKFPNLKERMVITTHQESPLAKAAAEQKLNVLLVPTKLGDRYSAFSPIGLFPLACVGVDILKLLEGAVEARSAGFNGNYIQNPPLYSALILYSYLQSGKTTNVNFFFQPCLETLGKWYNMLMSESLGKGGKGMTPIVSVGSVDLHSMNQLYVDGLKDKIFTFVNAMPTERVDIPTQLPIPSPAKLAGKNTGEIMGAIYLGTKNSYVKAGLPFFEVLFDSVSEKSLGEYMQYKMIEIMYLAKLMDVNAFDQPSVESYKKETRLILN